MSNLEARVAHLENKVRQLEVQVRRGAQRLATVEKEVGHALGRPLPILTEAQIQEECPCCGRTGS